MKLTIPLNYHAYYKLPKKSSWNHVVMQTEGFFDVTAVNREDVESMHRIGEKRDARTNFPFRTNDRAIEIIAHDGSYYAERFTVEQAQDEFSRLADADRRREASPLYGVAAIQHEEHDMSQMRAYGWYEEDAPRSKADVETALRDSGTLKDGELKRWTSMERDALQLASKVLSNFLVVGDTVFEKVNEPVLKIIVGDTVELVIDELKPMPRLNETPTRGTAYANLSFGIDEIEKARDFGQMIARAQGKTLADFTVIEDVTALYVTYRGETDNLYRYARQCYLAMTSRQDRHGSHTGRMFEHFNRDTALAVYDLAKAIEANENLTPEIIRCARAIVALHKDSNGKWDTFRKQNFASWSYQEAERIYNQFESLCIGLDQRLGMYDAKLDDDLDWNKQALDATPIFAGNERCFQVTSMQDVLRIDREVERISLGVTNAASIGNNHILAIEDFTTRKLVAAALMPASGSSDKPVIWTKLGQRRAEYLGVFNSFLKQAKQSDHDFASELDELGI